MSFDQRPNRMRVVANRGTPPGGSGSTSENTPAAQPVSTDGASNGTDGADLSPLSGITGTEMPRRSLLSTVAPGGIFLLACAIGGTAVAWLSHAGIF